MLTCLLRYLDALLACLFVCLLAWLQAEVNSKIKKAFCPPADDPGAISQNPIMDWVRHIVFAKNGQFELRRRDSDGGPKYGVRWCTTTVGSLPLAAAAGVVLTSGCAWCVVNRVYATMEEVEADYLSGALHPGDLKNSLKAEINAYAVYSCPLPSKRQTQSAHKSHTHCVAACWSLCASTLSSPS